MKKDVRLDRASAIIAAAIMAGATSALARPAVAQPATADEREIRLEKQLPDMGGLRALDATPARVTGFVVGSLSYNTHIQMVPEFAGGAPALADPDSANFRFDKFGLSLSKTFAPWLYGSVSVEVENHRDAHTHRAPNAAGNTFGCPAGLVCERFGAEEAETEAVLDRFHLTGIAPVGNGLSLALGRFDVPFGIERHDEPLNLTATTSEVFRFGRPQLMTGFLTSYQFSPRFDVAAWAVNRWESDTTHTPFDDNNKGKSYGARLGFTPTPHGALLNFGLGGFWGPEQDGNNSAKRWVLDADVTWAPAPRFLLAGEVISGAEEGVSFRSRGTPFAAPAAADQDVKWRGFYLLGHYDLRDWLGLSVRYGYLDDEDGARTGVAQKLRSITIAPILHLSRRIPELRPTGAVYARTQHPIDWVDLKIEYRYNRSDRPVFSDAPPASAILSADKSSHQLQLQVVVNF